MTGAAQGIGLAIARALGEAGTRMILADIDAGKGTDSAERLERDGLGAVALALDVTDPHAVEAAAGDAVARFGRVDILVNNAGIGSPSPALDLTDADWRRVMDVNTDAVFWRSRAFGRHRLGRRSGSIVNIGSMSGLIVNRGFAAAHHMVSKALAVEWAEAGVRVDAVAPGHTVAGQTELLRSRSDLRDVCLATTPMGRFAEPVEIASAVLFLASEAASYCTGTVLAVDGGRACW